SPPTRSGCLPGTDTGSACTCAWAAGIATNGNGGPCVAGWYGRAAPGPRPSVLEFPGRGLQIAHCPGGFVARGASIVSLEADYMKNLLPSLLLGLGLAIGLIPPSAAAEVRGLPQFADLVD